MASDQNAKLINKTSNSEAVSHSAEDSTRHHLPRNSKTPVTALAERPSVDLKHVLAELRKELDAIIVAIHGLERLERSGKQAPRHTHDLAKRKSTKRANS